jgi:glycosyltransferase involved in cell wall biosynthesis
MGKQLSGGDVTTIEIARHLKKLGYRVIIATSISGRSSCERVGLTAEYWVFDNNQKEPRTLIGATYYLFKRTVLAIFYFRKSFFQKPTIVIPSSDMFNDILSSIYLRGFKIRRFAVLHMVIPSPLKGYLGAFTNRKPKWGLDIRCTLNWLQQRLSLSIMRRKYDMVIPHNPYNRLFLSKVIHERQMANFDLIPGVDWQSISLVKNTDKIFDACWVGRFHPQKGSEDLIRSWRLVCNNNPDSKLVIVGNVKNNMLPLVKQLGLEKNVVFLGYLTGVDKFRIMSQSKLFIFPSYFEGRPAAIAEALACDLPVIAYDLPVYRDCNSEGVIVVPIGNINAFAQETINLLNDKELYSQTVNNIRNVNYESNWDLSIKNIVEAAENM